MSESQSVIGYSVFDPSEECYEYNENACIIADSVQTAERVRRDGMGDPGEARIKPVTFDDVMNDFGASCGEYAMEPSVLERFERLARSAGVSFQSEPYDNTELMVVQVNGTRSADE